MGGIGTTPPDEIETIKKTFLWELETLGTDYVDFGFLHCVDENQDFDKLVEIGVKQESRMEQINNYFGG